ncbi:DoxX family protein [Candidatus Woesearchaeota archaeon]|nr:DoxX family protein [Candidatus Woesearchaeota archaeon]
MFYKIISKYEDYFYLIFRIFIGFLFFQHGAQKLFGWFGKDPVALMSLMGLAGIIEFFGGIAIFLGLFTRFIALISAIEMLVAYFYIHIPMGFIPIENKGELALLYFAAFLVLFTKGNKKFGLERLIFKREF